MKPTLKKAMLDKSKELALHDELITWHENQIRMLKSELDHQQILRQIVLDEIAELSEKLRVEQNDE